MDKKTERSGPAAEANGAELRAAQAQFREKLADFLRGKGGQLGCRRRNFKRKTARRQA